MGLKIFNLTVVLKKFLLQKNNFKVLLIKGAGVGAAGIGAFTSVTGAEADGTVGADPDATGASTVFLLSLCAASTTSVIIITTRGPMVKYAGIVVPNSDNISIQ
jgi:Mn2+/Fe2+ NRAMP family transporter